MLGELKYPEVQNLRFCPVHRKRLIPLNTIHQHGQIIYDEFDCPACLLVWRLNARPVDPALGGDATQAPPYIDHSENPVWADIRESAGLP